MDIMEMESKYPRFDMNIPLNNVENSDFSNNSPAPSQRQSLFVITNPDGSHSIRASMFTPQKEPQMNQAEASLRRKKIMVLAIYGEFFATCFLMLPQFGVLANCYQNGWPSYMKVFFTALVAGFQVVSITFAFSEMSGAQCNCAISFALWITGKLSNRKVVAYIITQLFASFISAVVIYCTFTKPTASMFEYLAIFPTPGKDITRVFATEFFSTFILAMTAFTVALEGAEDMKKSSLPISTVEDSEGLTIYATNPQSKSAFAPFAIGFVVFSLSMYGGSDGIAMNPARMFGPAIFSGQWLYFFVYSLAEFAGAAVAGLMVHNIHQYRVDLFSFNNHKL